MSNPWKTAAAPVETQSLSQIMLEETARRCKTYKEVQVPTQPQVNKSTEVLPELKDATKTNADDLCDSDATIAGVLQLQYDKGELERLKKKNKNSKLSISYDNYFNIPPDLIDDSDCEDTDNNSGDKDWEQFEANVKEFGFDVKATNSVLSHLKDFQQHTEEVNYKQYTEKVNNIPKQVILDSRNSHLRAVIGLHKPTRSILFKILSHGVLDEINGIIATGHKSVVFHATGNTSCNIVPVPLECAVKVYKTKVDELKLRDKCADSSLNDIIFMMKPNEKVHLLAEKEMFNLIHMKKFGIKCPEMVGLKKHVLIMSLIGQDGKPACCLYELRTRTNWQNIYNKVVDAMFKLYNEAGMVHADLTPSNILWWDKECWFIDVSQSVHTDNPNCLELLLRDCTKVTEFFKNKKKIEGFKKTGEELFKYITGHDFTPSPKLNDNILSANFIDNDSSTGSNIIEENNTT